ncbi:MAG TPA: cytochrome c [Bacillales bacterium]|nr:cytochrome c [Bacillales bacterium]
MKSNPLIPFGVIMVLGVVLMCIIAFYGASQLGDESQAKGGGGETAANAKPQQIFEQNCASCHGKNLQGGVGPNLQHIGGKLSKDAILKQIKNGGGGMPPGVIKGEAADKVATWLSKKK